MKTVITNPHLSSIFLLSLPSYVHLVSDMAFSISLQSQKSLSINHWAKYEDPVTKLPEFTVCHWDKMSYFSTVINTIWSYCYTKTANSSLWCIQMDYALLFSTGNRDVLLTAWLENHILSGKIVPFPHRKWNHICWSYSSYTGNNNLYFNGKLLASQNLGFRSEKPIVDDYNDIYDAALIIGQEQDSVGGGYSVNQLYSGDISGFNIWDHTLTEDIVKEFAECKRNSKGNIVKWERDKWAINHGSINEDLNSNVFCESIRQLVVFPSRQPLQMAKILCAAHGGKIATPTTYIENQAIKAIVDKHPNCIDEAKTHHRNWGTAVWLGIKRINGEWYDMNDDVIVKPIEYQKWSIDPNYGDTSVDCSYIRSDGRWMYHESNNGTCPNLDICTVCSIMNTPVFTLKGLCPLTPVDYNFYMNINKTSGTITHYEGYKRGMIELKDSSWNIWGKGHNYTLPIGNKMTYPVGRLIWQSVDDYCEIGDEVHGDRKYLTLSQCQFGREFTCDSGHCIDIKKRCDRIKDCKDNSDEDDCHVIEVPSSYQKIRFPKKNGLSDHPLYLMTHILVESINVIDTMNMIIELTIRVRIRWTDGRIRLKNLQRNAKSPIPHQVAEKLWLPLDSIVHDNAMIGKVQQVKNDRRVSIMAVTLPIPVSLDDPFENNLFDPFNNILEIKQRFRITYICTFFLKKFPFDKQSCEFSMRINLESNSSLIFTKDSNGVSYLGPTTINQFEIERISSDTGIDGNDIWFKYKIYMSRLYMNQIINTIFPTCLLWLLAYSTLFINVQNFNNRFMGSVTSLLVLASLLGSIQNGLPKTSYFKYIDLWFLWYITNIFFIIISHIMLDCVTIDQRFKGKEKDVMAVKPINGEPIPVTPKILSRREFINRIAIMVFPVLNITFNTFYILRSLDG